MTTLKDAIIESLNRDVVKAQVINGNVMEVSRPTKKKPAFLKIAVDEDRAANYFGKPKTFGIMLFVNSDEWDKICNATNE